MKLPPLPWGINFESFHPVFHLFGWGSAIGLLVLALAETWLQRRRRLRHQRTGQDTVHYGGSVATVRCIDGSGVFLLLNRELMYLTPAAADDTPLTRRS
ncbi:MAG: hypothetical protein ABIR84_12475 [Candidatus Nitrotoga sp.]